MADGKLTLVIEADANGAISVIKQVTDAENELIGTNEKAGFSFTELNQALEIAKKAYAAVSQAATIAIGAISEGSAIGDVTEAFEKMSNRAGELSNVLIEDLKKATGGTISDLDLMRSSIEAVRAGAKPDEFTKLAEAARVLAEETGGNLTDELAQLSNAFETGQTRMLKNKLGIIDIEKAENDLAKSLGTVREALNKEGQVQAARNAILEASAKKTKEFGAVTDDSGDALSRISAAVTNATNRFKLALGTNTELNDALQRLADVIGRIDFTPIVDGLSKVATFAAGAIEKITGLAERIGGIFSSSGAKAAGVYYDFNGKLITIGETTKKVEQEVKVATETINTLGTEGKKSFIDLSYGVDEAKKAMKELDDLIKGSEVLGPGNFEGAQQFGDIVKAQADAQAEMIAGLLSSVIGVLNSGGSSRDIAGGLGGIGGGALGQAYGGPIGAVIGQEVGAALGKGVSDAIGHVFGGGNDVENKARDSVAEFFKKVFDETSIRTVIDGQLQVLEKLDFAQFTGNDSAIFQPLLDSSTQVQQAFGGIGLALQEQLGISEDIAGQIAATLFNNVGGSLNDLQLIIQQTGLSLEDMKGAIENAFLSGEVTALDALNAMRGVEQVMAEGIPGAVGATAEAFENIKKGGVNSLDALRDLGVELQEKFPGVTLTLEDLRKELLAQGKPIEEVDALMSAFAANGVDSLQELIDVSNELGISVLAQLQQSTTAFGEALSKTAEDIKTISDNLNELDGKSVDVKVNYQVSVSGDDIPSGAPGVAS